MHCTGIAMCITIVQTGSGVVRVYCTALVVTLWFNTVLVQSLVINVDLVTMFDPMISQQLHHIDSKCKECATNTVKLQQDQ